MSIAVANFMAGRDSVAFLCIVLCGRDSWISSTQFPSRQIYLGDAGSLFHRIHAGGALNECRIYARNLLAVISPVLDPGHSAFRPALVMWIRWRTVFR